MCFAPGYVRHAGSSDVDLIEFMAIVQAEHSAFPDIQIHLEAFIEQGDSVAFRWRSCGTHLGEYLGVPPTNRRIECWGITISRIINGAIVEDWASWNKYAVLEALGIVPIDSR